jgi:signal transduction histidine kinase
MANGAKIESSYYADLDKVVKWFIYLRWIAAAGVAVALLAAQLLIKYDLPYLLLYSLTAALFAANLIFSILKHRRSEDLIQRRQLAFQFHLQISSDFTFLFLLIFFTGFFQNPLIYYFVFHLMLASFIFPKRIVYVYLFSLVALMAVVIPLQYFHVVPHYALSISGKGPGDYYTNLPFQGFALVSTIILATYLIVNIKERIEERGHQVELELNRYIGLDRVKSQFILQVTHELRGPVAAIKGYHEMMIKGITGEISEKTQSTLTRANNRTTNLLMIIDEMLDFAYMKSKDDVTRESAEIDVSEIVRNNVDLFAAFAKQKEIELKTVVPKSLITNNSRDLLNIILGNLITNAIKYSARRGTVVVAAEEKHGSIHLHVSDEGMGIEPEELEKIFEEFYRTRRARKVENDGTGLGLSIVQKAVNLLNGKMSVYSELEKGTKMHIYLPKSQKEQLQEGA